MVFFEEIGVDFKGKNVVVVGRSDIVGSFVSYFLKNVDVIVIVCYFRIKDFDQYFKNVDVVVVVIGKVGFIKGEQFKEGVVVIDVGINYIFDVIKKFGQCFVGDVEFEFVFQVVFYIIFVFGGVGFMIVVMFFYNVVVFVIQWFDVEKQRKIVFLSFVFKELVLLDIVILWV